MGEPLLSPCHGCAGGRPEEAANVLASRMDQSGSKLPDFRSLTLRIKLSMNSTYQLTPSR
jgi:hypothetical protein